MIAPRRQTDDNKADLTWQLVEKLDDQRHYPRIELDVSVGFRNGSGQHCVAKLVNISPDGVQVRCNVASAQMLHPNGGKICRSNAPIVQTAIGLPFDDGTETLSVCAQLLYLTTVSEEPRCVVGLRFLDPRPKAQRILERFFADHLREYYVT
jgi:hypothetical protein